MKNYQKLVCGLKKFMNKYKMLENDINKKEQKNEVTNPKSKKFKCKSK